MTPPLCRAALPPRAPPRGARPPLRRAAPGPGSEAQARARPRMARELLTHGPAPSFSLSPSPPRWLSGPSRGREGAQPRPGPAQPPLTILLPPTATRAPGQRGGKRSGSRWLWTGSGQAALVALPSHRSSARRLDSPRPRSRRRGAGPAPPAHAPFLGDRWGGGPPPAALRRCGSSPAPGPFAGAVAPRFTKPGQFLGGEGPEWPPAACD